MKQKTCVQNEARNVCALKLVLFEEIIIFRPSLCKNSAQNYAETVPFHKIFAPGN